MKIAITATAANLDAEVDPRFGRCRISSLLTQIRWTLRF